MITAIWKEWHRPHNGAIHGKDGGIKTMILLAQPQDWQRQAIIRCSEAADSIFLVRGGRKTINGFRKNCLGLK